MSHFVIAVGSAGFFGLTVLTGVLMSRWGRPLNTRLFSVHKVAAIGLLLFGVFAVRSLWNSSGSFQGTETLLFFLAGATLLDLFVSGGLLSFDRFVSKPLKAVHALSPILLAVFLAVAFGMVFRAVGG
ncbi:MAG TPA: hypothetical protein P5560_08145 [Thermotogota bacterium]|nr:hypothetical protein [Thermotogota bacterium]HRW92897.1 hypothetical protein [Thermotogota bacterium]